MLVWICSLIWVFYNCSCPLFFFFFLFFWGSVPQQNLKDNQSLCDTCCSVASQLCSHEQHKCFAKQSFKVMQMFPHCSCLLISRLWPLHIIGITCWRWVSICLCCSQSPWMSNEKWVFFFFLVLSVIFCKGGLFGFTSWLCFYPLLSLWKLHVTCVVTLQKGAAHSVKIKESDLIFDSQTKMNVFCYLPYNCVRLCVSGL